MLEMQVWVHYGMYWILKWIVLLKNECSILNYILHRWLIQDCITDVHYLMRSGYMSIAVGVGHYSLYVTMLDPECSTLNRSFYFTGVYRFLHL